MGLCGMPNTFWWHSFGIHGNSLPLVLCDTNLHYPVELILTKVKEQLYLELQTLKNKHIEGFLQLKKARL